MTTKLILREVTLAFADIAQPKDYKGKKRWGANLIIEDFSTAALAPKEGQRPEFKPALAFVRSVLKDIATAEFAGKLPAGKDCSFRDGNDCVSAETGEVYGGFAGKFYIAAYRPATKKNGAPNTPPLVKNARLQDVRPGDAGFPQSGDIVTVIVDFYTQGGKNDANKDYGRKVNSGFETIQFIRQGEVTYGGAAAPSTNGLEAVEEEESPL